MVKLSVLSVLLATLALGVKGIAPQKQVLITYPNDTPEVTLSEAKSSIEKAVSLHDDLTSSELTLFLEGGNILHEFGKHPGPD